MQELLEGHYESIISADLRRQIDALAQEMVWWEEEIPAHESARLIGQYLHGHIMDALGHVKKSKEPTSTQLGEQVKLANHILALLKQTMPATDIEDGDIEIVGEKILQAVFAKVKIGGVELGEYTKLKRPETGLTVSTLFTGGTSKFSLDSELKREIASADEICFLVSFIRWSGIVLLLPELEKFVLAGGKVKVLTTTYMGASERKAIDALAKLPGTELRISYNTKDERLHAKGYLFKRNSGFSTAYIGSSNFSRAALTKGLEWNIKVTATESAHILSLFANTFQSYWEKSDFEQYDAANPNHRIRLAEALKQKPGEALSTVYFDLKPYVFQQEILDRLHAERALKNNYRNLVVAATGTGKTMISAFDFKYFLRDNPNARFLYVVHRKEILEQALLSYRQVLRNNNFGELWLGGQRPLKYDSCFASIQMLNGQNLGEMFAPDYYDYIVIDEVHHITASSYRGVINYFNPKILLGLTATPERMDGKLIQEDFGHVLAAEIRLTEAINKQLLAPFYYFGVSETLDLNEVEWVNGRYNTRGLTRLYTKHAGYVGSVADAVERYTKGSEQIRCLGFCASIVHAQFMADSFTSAGYKAIAITSSPGAEEKSNRMEAKRKLIAKEINFVFVVDIYNEGVDIPEVDTVLFLRPTESMTIFLQQLGRGLRLCEGKENLTILDFVGNARAEYDFESKLRALTGPTNKSIKEEIETGFGHLPLGCSVVLEEVAKSIILRNISANLHGRAASLIQKAITHSQRSSLPITLANFLSANHLKAQDIYKYFAWNELLFKANLLPNFIETGFDLIKTAAKNKWLTCSSFSYFSWIRSFAQNDFKLVYSGNSVESKFALMLYYDLFGSSKLEHPTLSDAFTFLGQNKYLKLELSELMTLLINEVTNIQLADDVLPNNPLQIHGRYTRDQIFSGLGFHTLNKKFPNREGSAILVDENIEVLFITLNKKEENYSPTTFYHDYALTPTEFHWQSQNSAGPHTAKGQNYINQIRIGRKILLFIREEDKNQWGRTMGYVFAGHATYISHTGSRPMDVIWKLHTPLPAFLYQQADKLAG